jgi:hypothetical protein
MSKHALRRAALQTLGQHIVIAKRHVSFGSWSCENAFSDERQQFDGVAKGIHLFGADYARIAAMSCRTPMMLMTRVRL